MNRHYYVSNNLDELEEVERELEAQGIHTEQIHVLSDDDAGLDRHQTLHAVSPFMKKDVVRSSLIGMLSGLCLALLILGLAYISGLHNTAAGWLPFGFLAGVVFGFCFWIGGFRGIQVPNAHFEPYRDRLQQGKHLFFVDVDPEQESTLETVVAQHRELQDAGTGSAPPHWVVAMQHRLNQAREAI